MAEDLFEKELTYLKRFDSESDQPYSIPFETSQVGAAAGKVDKSIPDKFIFFGKGMTGFCQRVVAAPDLELMNEVFLRFNLTWTPNNKGVFEDLITFANVFGVEGHRQPYLFGTPLVFDAGTDLKFSYETVTGWPVAVRAFGIRLFGRLVAKKGKK